jgi:hypothetical protein
MRRLPSHSENVYVLQEIRTLAPFVVGLVTRLRAGQPKNRGSIPSKGKIFSSPPTSPGRYCGRLSLLCNGYRGHSAGGKEAEDVKPTTRLRLGRR